MRIFNVLNCLSFLHFLNRSYSSTPLQEHHGTKFFQIYHPHARLKNVHESYMHGVSSEFSNTRIREIGSFLSAFDLATLAPFPPHPSYTHVPVTSPIVNYLIPLRHMSCQELPTHIHKCTVYTHTHKLVKQTKTSRT